MEFRKNLTPITVLFFCMPFLYGLLYEFSATFAGSILAALMLFTIWKQRSCTLSKHPICLLLCALLGLYGLSCFYAIDSGMAFMGFLRRLPIFFWTILLFQAKEKEREHIASVIPIIGAIMTLFSSLGFFIPIIKEQLFATHRMAGFFQYANTFALFLLLGSILLLYQEKKSWWHWLFLGIHFFGILCTGSRIVFLLAMGCILWHILRKKNLLALALLGIGVLGLGVGTVFVPALQNSIGRIFTTSLHSSTMLGRFLYVQDALPLLIKHPFGMGAYGYSYTSGTVATGYYQVQYVHNDYLQLGLDIGILPMVVFLGIMIFSIIKSRSGQQRMLLLVFAIHSLFEFNLEYSFLCMLLILFLPIWNEAYECKVNTKGILALTAFSILSILCFIPVGIASLFAYNEHYEEALAWYPSYTDAREDLAKLIEEELETVEDLEQLEELSDTLLEDNRYSRVAYQINAAVAFYYGDFAEMIDAEEKTISLSPYYSDEYETYASLLLMALEAYQDTEDDGQKALCAEALVALPDKLASLESSMSKLGKSIKDQPDFTLDQDILDLIEEYKTGTPT